MRTPILGEAVPQLRWNLSCVRRGVKDLHRCGPGGAARRKHGGPSKSNLLNVRGEGALAPRKGCPIEYTLFA